MKSGQETFRFGSNAVEHPDEKMARLQLAAPVFDQVAIQRQSALVILEEQPCERVRACDHARSMGSRIIRMALISGLSVAISRMISFDKAA